jgi:hypothetical protein
LKLIYTPPNKNIAFVKDSFKPYSTASQWQKVLTIESRGLDFVDWKPTYGAPFRGEGQESGTVFDDIEFEEGERDWVGYDEKGACPVGVTEIEGKFEKTKK